ncbi:nuclear transport factor 2 family protein [Mycobacterium colombiense]
MDDAQLRTRVGAADLMASYQFLADHGKVHELSELFLPDGVFVTDTEEFVGPDAILGFFSRVGTAFVSASFLPARHHLSSIYIDPQPDGGARTYACFQLIGSKGLDHWGTYRDEIVDTRQGWRFARRKVKIEGHIRDSPVVGLLGLPTVET